MPTVKQYQKGGTAKSIKTSPPNTEEDFISKWTNSPMHLDMLKKSAPNDYEDLLEGRKENIKDISVEYYKKRPSGVDKKTGGDSNPRTGQIRIFETDPKLQKGIVSHEKSHTSDKPSTFNTFKTNFLRNSGITPDAEYERLIPKSDINLINNYSPDNLKDTPNYNLIKKAIDKGRTSEEKIKEWNDYVAEPTETRARLNDLREQALNSKIYNPLKERISPQQYEELKSNIDNSNGFDPLKQLKTIYSDQEIINLLNTISNVDKQDNSGIMYAQNGGEVLTQTFEKGGQKTDKERQAYAFYISKGWTPEQAIGIVGNLKHESNFDTTVLGTADDKGSRAIAQWHGDRLKLLKSKYGEKWTDFKNQLEFVDWELRNTHKSAGDRLKNSKGVWEAGRIVSDDYEIPKVKFNADERRQRNVADLAMKFKGIKLTPEDNINNDVTFENSVAPYMYAPPKPFTTIQIPEMQTQQVSYLDTPQETTNLAEETEQKQSKINPQEEAFMQDLLSQMAEGVGYVEPEKSAVFQDGGRKQFKLQDERNLVQKDNTSTQRPNVEIDKKQLAFIAQYAKKNSIPIKEASERLYFENQYNQNNQIRSYTPQTTKSKVWEVATHPMTAAGYVARNEELPDNFSRGQINPHEMAVDIVNPFFYADQVGKFVKNTSEGNFTEAGMNALSVLPIAAEYQTIGRGLSRVGKTLGTEEGLLSNAYKLNSKAITSENFNNPNSFYRQIDTPTFNEGLESGLIKGKQAINKTQGENIISLNKSFGDDAYYFKGKLYSPRRADYIYEVNKGEEFFKPRVNNKDYLKKGVPYTVENTNVRVSKTPIPLEEATIYKKDWLQGYKQIQPQFKDGGQTPISSEGMYAYPNQKVIVPTNGAITMKNIPHSILGISKESGERKIMKPENEYFFNNTKTVTEVPLTKAEENFLKDIYETRKK